MKDPRDLLHDVSLFLPMLESFQEFELCKIARTTILKLTGLSESFENLGFLSQEQKVILDLCQKDYDYLSQKIQQIKLQPKRVLH